MKAGGFDAAALFRRFLRLRKNRIAPRMPARIARPPTTPPIMGPIFVFGLGLGVVTGEVVVLDDNEAVAIDRMELSSAELDADMETVWNTFSSVFET